MSVIIRVFQLASRTCSLLVRGWQPGFINKLAACSTQPVLSITEKLAIIITTSHDLSIVFYAEISDDR
jgi:hypothetical protein